MTLEYFKDSTGWPTDDWCRKDQEARDRNPLFIQARKRRLAWEAELAAREARSTPAQHPFEYDPRRPSLHP